MRMGAGEGVNENGAGGGGLMRMGLGGGVNENGAGGRG